MFARSWTALLNPADDRGNGPGEAGEPRSIKRNVASSASLAFTA
jgi:hypothetical protein